MFRNNQCLQLTGGDIFSHELSILIKKKIREKFDESKIENVTKEQFYSELFDEINIEDYKLLLSTSQSIDVEFHTHWHYRYDPGIPLINKREQISITQLEYINCIQSHFDKIKNTLTQFIASIGADPDIILLIGGASCTPGLRDKLQEHLLVRFPVINNYNYAVSIGAALVCNAEFNSESNGGKIKVETVSGYNLYMTMSYNSMGNNIQNNHIEPLISKNTTLPRTIFKQHNLLQSNTKLTLFTTPNANARNITLLDTFNYNHPWWSNPINSTTVMMKINLYKDNSIRILLWPIYGDSDYDRNNDIKSPPDNAHLFIYQVCPFTTIPYRRSYHPIPSFHCHNAIAHTRGIIYKHAVTQYTLNSIRNFCYSVPDGNTKTALTRIMEKLFEDITSPEDLFQQWCQYLSNIKMNEHTADAYYLTDTTNASSNRKKRKFSHCLY